LALANVLVSIRIAVAAESKVELRRRQICRQQKEIFAFQRSGIHKESAKPPWRWVSANSNYRLHKIRTPLNLRYFQWSNCTEYYPMAIKMENLKIYNFHVNSIREVTTPQKKKEWLKRMKDGCKMDGFVITEDMHCFDTDCPVGSENFDDCATVVDQ
jgi:hypothetical protein